MKAAIEKPDVPAAIAEMVRRIVDRFDPEKIILFGSHARGDATPDSDVDLLVVMPVQGSKREAQIQIRAELHDMPVAKDIIVTRPEDFSWRREIAGTIERPADREGRLLYERESKAC
jgi:predicted nucleotidyltransferase